MGAMLSHNSLYGSKSYSKSYADEMYLINEMQRQMISGYNYMGGMTTTTLPPIPNKPKPTLYVDEFVGRQDLAIATPKCMKYATIKGSAIVGCDGSSGIAVVTKPSDPNKVNIKYIRRNYVPDIARFI